MAKYLEPAKEIDVFGEYDVIIVGGGTAGLSAAIASGRNKAKTLLIEQFGYRNPPTPFTKGVYRWYGDCIVDD